MLLVTITCSKRFLELNLSLEGGENTACEAHANILLAPSYISKLAPEQIVPPVSIISSIRIAVLPFTSPITVRLSATL